MKEKLAIFDLDGTLFDTRAVNYHAYQEAIRSCGYPFSLSFQEYTRGYAGTHYAAFLTSCIPGISSQEMERIHTAKKSIYTQYLPSAVKNEHLFSILLALRPTYQIALATTGSRKNVL